MTESDHNNHANAGAEKPVFADESASDAPKKQERWFVPFVIIPLAIAVTILGVIGLSNFLLGRGGPRTLDELLEEVKGGGANARKQAAFHLARNIAEEADRKSQSLESNHTKNSGAPIAPAHAAWPRRELAKIENACDLVKDDHETRRFLVAALGLVGDDETADYLGRKLNDADSKDPDGTLRVAMLHAMARICSDHSLPVFNAEFERATGGESDPGTLNILAAGYGNLTNPKATERLVAILQFAGQRNDSSARLADGSRGTTWKEVRWTAAVNLAKRRDLDAAAAKLAIPTLVAGIEDVHADAFRAESERIFRGAGGSGSFLPAGVTMQGDENRQAAAQQLIAALAFLSAKESVEMLKKVSTADPNLRVRSFALEALAQIDPLQASRPTPR